MGWTTSWIEVLGFVTGAACVWLAVRENIWNWPVGIANNLFYLVVFFHSKLYADAGLQIFYMAISAYGWWSWLGRGKARGQQPARPELQIGRTRRRQWLALAPVTLLSTVALALLLRRFTDSNVPFGDGLTTALSLTAQYMLSRKLLENWCVWIVADVIYIGLYCYKSLYLTAVLYFIFLCMCVVGYMQWRRQEVTAELVAAATAE